METYKKLKIGKSVSETELLSLDEKGNNALIIAADLGNLDIVKYLISRGVNINIKNKNGYSPLYFALGKKHFNIVEYLINSGADVNIQNNGEDAPLHLAADIGDLNIVKKLVESGADINIENDEKKLPLQYAIKKNNYDVVKYLFNLKYKKDIKSILIAYLFDVIKKDKIEGLPFLTKDDINIKFKDINCNSLLHFAVENDKVKNSRILIKLGADVNGKNKNGNTPLHLVDDGDICEILLKAGADVNSKNINGSTPLHTHPDHGGICELLLKAGADVNSKNNEGETPLHLCSESYVCEILLEAGADVNSRANYLPMEIRHNIYMFSLEMGSSLDLYEHVKLNRDDISSDEVVEYKYNPVMNKNYIGKGWTPLHYAVYYGSTHYIDPSETEVYDTDFSIIELLIEYGADIDAKDKGGWTPLLVAAERGNLEIIKYLINLGADVSAMTNEGDSMISEMAFNGMLDKEVSEFIRAFVNYRKIYLMISFLSNKKTENILPLIENLLSKNIEQLKNYVYNNTFKNLKEEDRKRRSEMILNIIFEIIENNEKVTAPNNFEELFLGSKSF